MAIKFLSGLNLSDVTAGSILKLDSNGNIVAATAGTDYAASSPWTEPNSGTLYTNKKVGIGYSDAAAKLHVYEYQTTTPKLLIEDGNTGDASMQFKISTQFYTMGIDNSDSDKFVLAASSALGTTNVIEVSTTGVTQFGNDIKLSNGWTLTTASTSYAKFGSWVNVEGTGLYTFSDILMDLDDSSSRFVIRGVGNTEHFIANTATSKISIPTWSFEANDITQTASGDNWSSTTSTEYNQTGIKLSRSGSGYVSAAPYKLIGSFTASVSFKTSDCTHLGIIFAASETNQDNDNYAVILRNNGSNGTEVRVQKRLNSAQSYPIGAVNVTSDCDDGNWHELTVSYNGKHIVVDIDGTNYFNQAWTDTSFTSPGLVGLAIYDGTTIFNDLQVHETPSTTTFEKLQLTSTEPQLVLKNPVSGTGNAVLKFEEGSGSTQNATITFNQGGQNNLKIATGYQSATDENLIHLAPAGNIGLTVRGGTGSNNGNVGIGTTAPGARLTLNGDGHTDNYQGVLRINNTDSSKWSYVTLPDTLSGNSNSNNYYLIGRGSSISDRVMSFHIPRDNDYGDATQPKFGFYSTGADLLHSIEAETGNSYFKGKVGIANSSPHAELTVQGKIDTSDTDNGAFRIYNGSTFRGGWGTTNWAGSNFGDSSSDLVAYVNGSNNYYIGTNAQPRLTVSGTGNVGIGTTSPGNKLHVNGDVIRVVNSTWAGIESHNTNGSWESFVGTESGGGGNRYNSASSQHTFYNNSNAVARINSSGNLGIGTTSPSYRLDVAGDINTNSALKINGLSANATDIYGLYTYSSSTTRTSASNANVEWIKIISTTGGNRLKLKLSHSGDNSNCWDEFLIAHSKYSFKHHIQRLPGGRYNSSKVLAVLTTTTTNTTMEVWVKVAAMSSGSGVFSWRSNVPVLTGTEAAATITTTKPTMSSGGTELDTNTTDRDTYTLMTSRGIYSRSDIQAANYLATEDDYGLKLRGRDDVTHKIYYHSNDSANVWETTTEIIFRDYNSGTPLDRFTFEQDGSLQLNAYGAGLLRTNAAGAVTVDTSTYVTGVDWSDIASINGTININSTTQIGQGDTETLVSFQNSGTERGRFEVDDSANSYFVATGFKTSTASTGFLKADGTVDTGDFFSGAYADLTGTPTLGTMAAANTSDYKDSDTVESYVAQELGSYLPLTGGTLTGKLRVDTRLQIGDDTSSSVDYIYDGYLDANSAYFHQPKVIIRSDSSAAGGLDEAPVALAMFNRNGTNNTWVKMSFASREVNGSGNTVSIAGIAAQKTTGTANSWASGKLYLWTKNGASFVENMVLQPNGNVGVGTSSPGYKLDVAGTIRSGTTYRTSINGDASGAVVLFGSASDNDSLGVVGAYSSLFNISSGNGDISFQFNSTERMRLNSTGNLGIGTTSPGGRLELNGSGQSWTTAPAIRMWDSYNSKGWLVGNVNNVTAGDFYIRTLPGEDTNPVPANQKEFVIKHETGNVGINNLNPSHKLDVNGVIQGYNSVRVNSAATGSPYFGLYQGGGERAYLQYVDSGDELVMQSDGMVTIRGDVQNDQQSGDPVISFKQSSTELAKIDQEGNVHAGGFKVSGTTGFLKSDGSVDTSTYASSTHNHDSDYVAIAGGYYDSDFSWDGTHDFQDVIKVSGASATTTNTTALFYGTNGVVEKRDLGSNAFNSTSYLPLAGGTVTGNINLGDTNNAIGQSFVKSGGSLNLIIDSNNNQTVANFIIEKDTQTAGGGTELFRVQENGRVGIATDAPTKTLDVNGSAYFRSTIGVNGEGNGITVDSGYSTNGRVGLMKYQGLEGMLVSGNATKLRLGRRTDAASVATPAPPTIVVDIQVNTDGTVQLPQYGAGILKTNASGVISLDTSTYLTSESDTLDSVLTRGDATYNTIHIRESDRSYTFRTNASWGGWARTPFYFEQADGTGFGGFGAYGGNGTTLSKYYIGGSYNDNIIEFHTDDSVIMSGNLTLPDKILHSGDADTYIKFDTNRVRIVAGNITKFDSDTIYTGTVQSVTGTGTVSGLSLSDDGDPVDPTLTLSGTISISSANITDVAANADATPSWVPATNPNYLTSYTETDTLASVTGRGASTTTSLSIRNLTSRTILPEADRTYDLGGEETRWRVVFCETLDSAGQHESQLQNPEGEKSIGDYATGTVLVWKGGKNIPCTEAADHMRMGIAVNGIDSPLVQGAEPVLVTGSVNEGDYLVTSSVEGHAKAITPQFMRQHMLFDCVIGKALESGEGDSHLIKTWINI